MTRSRLSSQMMLRLSRWNQKRPFSRGAMSNVSGGAIIHPQGLTPAPLVVTMPLRYHSSVLPPTRGLLESVTKYLFQSPAAAEDCKKQDAEQLINIPIGSMTQEDLADAKRAISLQMETKPVSKLNVENAWDILDRIAKELKHGDSQVSMTPEEQTELLNTTLTGWMRSVGNHRMFRSEKRNVLLEANAVLSRMDRYQPCFPPNAMSYNITMRALNKRIMAQLAKNKKTGKTENADAMKMIRLLENIFEYMHKEASNGNNTSIAPNVITYTLLIKGIAYSQVPGNNDRVNEILTLMKEEGVEPDTQFYNALLAGCIKSGHLSAPDQAESLLHRMQQEYESGKNVKPDVFSFGTVICAWATLGDGDEAIRACDIVTHMQQQYDEGFSDVEPNGKCYGYAIGVYTKRGEISKAEALLEQMKEKNIEADYFCYAPLISACARTNDANAADKYLVEAKSFNITPSVHDYNRVIRAWQRSDDQRAEARIKILTEEMNNGRKPVGS